MHVQKNIKFTFSFLSHRIYNYFYQKIILRISLRPRVKKRNRLFLSPFICVSLLISPFLFLFHSFLISILPLSPFLLRHAGTVLFTN